MSYGYDDPIIIWAYGDFVEIANRAVAHYQKDIDSSIQFDVLEISAQEIPERLIIGRDVNELPDIILVRDQEIKKYLKDFRDLFSVLDDCVESGAYNACKIVNITDGEHLYGCPCSSEPVALYYNKTTLNEDLGVEDIQEDILWDDFMELGRRLKNEMGVYLLPPANYLTRILMQSTGRLYYDADGYIAADGAQEVLELIEQLNAEGLLYPEPSISSDRVSELIANGEIFSVIGAPYWFTEIKKINEEQGLEQEWSLTKIPKKDIFQYEVDLGGYSWMVINKARIDDQNSVFDFLAQLFSQDNEYSRKLAREMAEIYDIVPAVNYVGDILEALQNNGCFLNRQVIKYLMGLSEYIPEIYFGYYVNDITQNLNEIVINVAFGSKTVTAGVSDFQYICAAYSEIESPRILDYITIDREPDKTDYYKYEYFLCEGMIVHAYYMDGTDEIITDYSYSPRRLDLEDSFVTVSYTSGRVRKTAKVAVKVSDRILISITASSMFTFLHNDEITPSLFSVIANYNVGPSSSVTATSVSPTILSNVGQQKVTVYYTENNEHQETDVTITVYRKLSSIFINAAPNKLSYYKGERFDRTGLSIVTKYSDGTQDTRSSGYLKITPEIVKFKDGQDTAKLTVSYTERGVTAETTLTVYKKTGTDLEDCDIPQDMSESGTGSVNLSTGNLTYKFNDFTGYDAIIPISISHIYKPEIGDSFCMGNNWRLNLQQELVKENGNWQYTDKEGKTYSFDDGYEIANERSSVRNEKLGFDLFEDSENQVVKLIDRSNNTLVFTPISGKYRFTEMHMYPSATDNPIEAYSLVITYLTDGRISTVTSGKTVSGNRPTVTFEYSNRRLSELKYSCSGQKVVARYIYNDGNLDTVTLIDENVDNAFARSTKFDYEDKSFTIRDLSSKNTNGTAKSLIYAFDDIYRVKSYTIGYETNEQDETKISYSSKGVSLGANTDISLTTVTENNGNISVVAFNGMGVVSKYDYDITGASHIKPKKVNSEQSRGFSYKSLAETYSDTLDVFHDDFESGTDNWTGATKTNTRAISGAHCVSGTSLNKSYTLTSNNIDSGTTLYLSLWTLKHSNASDISLKVTISSGSETSELTHKLDKNLINKWQFTSFCLGKRKSGDVITVKLSSDYTIYMDDVRLTKLPYETPDDDIADTVYDAFGNVEKSYQYNPIDKSIEYSEYTYNSAHQVTQQITKSGNKQKNLITNTYNGGLLTSKKEYGANPANYTEEKYTYTDNALSSAADENNVETRYSDGANYQTSVIVGEYGSPDGEQKEQFFSDSGVIKTLSSGSLQNGFTYLENGNLQTAKFGYSSSAYEAEMTFEYDTYGNLSALKIGTVSFLTLEYDYKHLNKTTYANGDYVAYTYDVKDRITAVSENGTETVSVVYSDNAEDLVTITHSNGLTYISKTVNQNGLTGEYSAYFSGIARILRVVGYAANGTGNITSVGYFTDNSDTPFEKCVSTKDGNGLLTKMERSYHGAQNTYSYNSFYQLSSKTTAYTIGSTSKQFKTNYYYETISGYRKGTRITNEDHYDGNSEVKGYYYDYYKNGNLRKIRLRSDTQSEYVYDEYGRLTEEYNYALSRAYKFTYDNGGNITTKETYCITGGTVADTSAKTDIYDYSTVASGYGQNSAWKDQLKSYNGVAIKYDESGNPLNYLGKVMTWRGRKLMGIDGVAMDYDYNGLRVKKGDKTYYWQSSNLIMERWFRSGSEHYIYYYYDESGVCGMNYDGTEYYFRKNIFGDVMAVYDGLGNLQCTYKYDAWGNHKVYNASGSEIGKEVINVGNINPFRYRSYYWDGEFGLYYLQSRYYDPALGRFISADAISYLNPEDVIGFNLYSYCGNNPVMGIDPNGTWDWARFGRGIAVVAAAALAIAVTVGTLGTGSVVGGVIIAGTIGAAGSMFSQTVMENKTFSEVNYLQVAMSGVSSALTAIPGVGYRGGIAISGAAGFFGGLAEGKSLEDAALDAVKSAGITAIAGGITRGIGLGKIAKIGKGNYAGKKVFLNHSGIEKLSSFNPAANKTQSLLGYIYKQLGAKGLSQLANDTAGTVVNTIADIISSIIP